MAAFYDFDALTIDGKPLAMSSLRGQVVLVVNTASACGFTPQFAGLQALHTQFASQGLVILGFPCNQFGAQDKGSNVEIASFCERNYGVTFQMMSKIEVNGADAHALYKWLREQATGILGSSSIKWNFTKFLVDRQGQVLNRFAPNTTPSEMTEAIAAALQAA